MDMASFVLQIALILVVFVVFYLTLVRPQQTRLRRHQALLSSLRAGDRISTNGGLVGTIVDTSDEHLVKLEIAPNVSVMVMRKGIDHVWPVTEPIGETGEQDQRRTSMA